jgi:hypothetical protein
MTRLGMLAVALVLTFAFGAGQCSGGEQACTLIGCMDGVHIEVADELVGDAASLTACMGGMCSDHELQQDLPGVVPLVVVEREGLAPRDRVDVTVEVRDEDGGLLAEHQQELVIEEQRPNGPGCPPVCATGRVTVASHPG